MSGNSRWFGWNLRTLNVVLFCGGLLAFAALKIGVALRVLSWPWQVWAMIAAGGVAVALLIAGMWLLVRSVRQRRWKSLGAIATAAAVCLVALALVRNAFLPWTTIEGRVVDAKTGDPLSGLTVRAQMTNASQATRQTLADERLMLAWLLSSGGEARTDAQGRYRLRALPLGAYNLWAEQPGRTGPAIDSLAGNRNATTSAPDLRLGPGGIVKGRVIDATTGRPLKLERPIPWVDVVMFYGPARPPSGGAVESSPIHSDGTFELRAAPGLNSLYLNLTCDARAPEITQVDVKEGETVEIDLVVHREDQ